MMFRTIFFKYKAQLLTIMFVVSVSLLFPYCFTLFHWRTSVISLASPKPYGKTVVIAGNGESTRLDVEEFIPLVLYSIMPDDYSEEQLKAMAVIIRTYIVYRLREQEKDSGQGETVRSESLGLPFTTYSELEKKWGKKYEENYNRTMNLIAETNREVIYCGGEPIFPCYHELSAGITNDGGEAYLCPVESKQDMTSPDYMRVLYFTADNLMEKLSVLPVEKMETEQLAQMITVSYKENSEYVENVKIGDTTVAIDEWQRLLGLPSQAFTFEPFADGFKFVSKGIGNGKGMSLYGAGKMAEEGKSYRDILYTYYTAVDIHS